MSRTRKILTAGIIIGLGVLFSWPFRLSPSESSNSSLERSVAQAESNIPFDSQVPATSTPSDLPQIAAKAMSSGRGQNLKGFDLINHPSTAEATDELIANSGPTPEPMDEPKPAYKTSRGELAQNPSKTTWPQGVAHIVRNGDTLEKLAKRYLGDSDRGLEIFDFNRDLLSNPHLLPIGVELRMPVDHTQIAD